MNSSQIKIHDLDIDTNGVVSFFLEDAEHESLEMSVSFEWDEDNRTATVETSPELKPILELAIEQWIEEHDPITSYGNEIVYLNR